MAVALYLARQQFRVKQDWIANRPEPPSPAQRSA